MGASTSNQLRPVQINFDLYVGSEDNEFKKELIQLMIVNVKELKEAVQEAWKLQNIALYNKAVHKTKSTVGLLNDKEFSETIDHLKNHFSESSISSDPQHIHKLNSLCESIILSLEQESMLISRH